MSISIVALIGNFTNPRLTRIGVIDNTMFTLLLFFYPSLFTLQSSCFAILKKDPLVGQ